MAKPMMKERYQDFALLHFLVFLFGFTAILGLLISIPPFELVFLRTFLAAILLFAFFRSQIFPLKLSHRQSKFILLTGILIATHWILFFLSARLSNASVCLAGMATTSLWTAFLEPLFFKRRISLTEVSFGILAFIGLWIIFKFEFDSALGLVLAIISAILAALFSILNALFVKKDNPYKITFLEMAMASVFSFALLPLISKFIEGEFGFNFHLVIMDWLYILILSGICTVYAFSKSVELMKRITPFTFNLTLNLEPVYGIILAYLVFGESEKMSVGFYLGTILILIGVIAFPILKRKKSSKIIG
jgi:drug/metabolite transporter (DMT)-like permease